jgi:hypothetical protein
MGKMMWQGLRATIARASPFTSIRSRATHDEWTDRFRGLGDRFVELADLREEDAALRIAEDDLDYPRRPVDAHEGCQARHPRAKASAGDRDACRERRNRGPFGDRLQADRSPCRSSREPGVPARDAAADGGLRLSASAASLLPQAHRYRRSELGIDDGTVVIGAFVTALKLSPRCLRLWGEVLQRVPRAQIAFSPTNFRVP